MRESRCSTFRVFAADWPQSTAPKAVLLRSPHLRTREDQAKWRYLLSSPSPDLPLSRLQLFILVKVVQGFNINALALMQPQYKDEPGLHLLGHEGFTNSSRSRDHHAEKYSCDGHENGLSEIRTIDGQNMPPKTGVSATILKMLILPPLIARRQRGFRITLLKGMGMVW